MSRRSLASVDYLTRAVPSKTPVPEIPGGKSPKPQYLPPQDVSKMIYTPLDLNNRYRGDGYYAPTAAQISHADAFFFRASFRHEWTCAHYNDLPGVKTESDKKQTKGHLPLPEILLLGHTNAGKLTLVNNLFMNKEQAKNTNGAPSLAYVSRRAGFTKCLNCYNVSDTIRIVDSPGYGEFGEEQQGEIVLEYIRRRKELRRTFLVVDSTAGIRDEDAALIDFLVEHGVPFEIVFTKVDAVVSRKFPKIKMKSSKNNVEARLAAFEAVKDGNSNVVAHFDSIIQRSGVSELAALPRLLFNNSCGNALLPRRYGFREIRFAILESCGLALENSERESQVEEEMVHANKSRRKRVVRRMNPSI